MPTDPRGLRADAPGHPGPRPGEQVTAEAVSALMEARAPGVRIAYAADPTLTSLRVAAGK